MRKMIKVGLGAGGTLVIALGAIAPAYADIAPGPKDVVGVGSDTVQNVMNFIADGDYQSDSAFQTQPNKFRIFNFDATPDANDRAGYANVTGSADCSTPSASKCLYPTIVLRAGSSPVRRPNGSSEGIAAISAVHGSGAGEDASSGGAHQSSASPPA